MSEKDTPEINPKIEMEEERKIMVAYSDTAKSYTQLSIGALVLTITFSEKVLGHTVVGCKPNCRKKVKGNKS